MVHCSIFDLAVSLLLVDDAEVVGLTLEPRDLGVSFGKAISFDGVDDLDAVSSFVDSL